MLSTHTHTHPKPSIHKYHLTMCRMMRHDPTTTRTTLASFHFLILEKVFPLSLKRYSIWFAFFLFVCSCGTNWSIFIFWSNHNGAFSMCVCVSMYVYASYDQVDLLYVCVWSAKNDLFLSMDVITAAYLSLSLIMQHGNCVNSTPYILNI